MNTFVITFWKKAYSRNHRRYSLTTSVRGREINC